VILKKIDKYEEYLKLQREKTLNPEKRLRWIKNHDENNSKWIASFRNLFEFFYDIIAVHRDDEVCCIGARTGDEVMALRQLGFYKALGTDLVPFRDIVVQDDIHDMKFEDDTIGLFYTNIFDHVLYPRKAISEINRCLKKGGKAFFQLQIGAKLLSYGTCLLEHPDDFHDIIQEFDDLNIIYSDVNFNRADSMGPIYNADLNWNVIVEKGRSPTFYRAVHEEPGDRRMAEYQRQFILNLKRLDK